MEIYADYISEAWEKSIEKLLSQDVPYVYTQRGTRAREIIGLQMTVDFPTREPVLSAAYLFGDVFVDKYCRNILEASCGEQSIQSRIVKRKSISQNGNNQVNKIVSLLRRMPDSRRAVISLWDAAVDMNSEHPPCACTIQFMIREGRLDTVAYFRSNDSWMAALPDMVAMTKLASLIAQKLKIPVGKYIHFAASYHLYEPDIIPAQVSLGGGSGGTGKPFTVDRTKYPVGN